MNRLIHRAVAKGLPRWRLLFPICAFLPMSAFLPAAQEYASGIQWRLRGLSACSTDTSYSIPLREPLRGFEPELRRFPVEVVLSNAPIGNGERGEFCKRNGTQLLCCSGSLLFILMGAWTYQYTGDISILIFGGLFSSLMLAQALADWNICCQSINHYGP